MMPLKREWESVTAVTEWLDTTPRVLGILGSNPSSEESSDFRNKFTLTASLPVAIDLARDGWTERNDDLASTLGKVEAMVARDNIVKRWAGVTHSVVGSRVNMARYLEGRPDCAVRKVKSEVSRKSPVVRIGVNLTVAAGVTSAEYVWRGACLVALTQLIESAGWKVELDGHWIVRATGDDVDYVVRLKDSDTRPSLSDLMFSIAHPSMLRRFIFGAMERESVDLQRRLGYEYGQVIPASKEIKSGYDLFADFGTRSNIGSLQGVVAWVVENLTELGLIKA